MIMKLRQRATIIMIIVLVAFMGAIVLQWGLDIMGTGGRALRGSRRGKEDVLAVIGNSQVTIVDYRRSIDSVRMAVGDKKFYNLARQERDELVQTAWESVLQAAVWKEVLERERVMMGDEEFRELVYQIPPSQFLQDTNFYVEGQFNWELYWQLLNSQELPPELAAFLGAHVQNLAVEAPREKIRSDVRNSIRLTPDQMGNAQRESATVISVEALFIYELPPVDSSVTDAELAVYYEENVDLFEREKRWELKTLIFPILPSAEDSAALQEHIDDLVSALGTGYDFEQLALDYTGDSSRLETRPTRFMDAVEFENLSGLAEGELSQPYFFRGAWHLARMVSNEPDTIILREIVIPLEFGSQALDSVLTRVEEFSKRGRKEDVDSLIMEYAVISRPGPLVTEDEKVFVRGFPYNDAVKTFALKSKVGDISAPSPVTGDAIYIFATVAITDEETVEFDIEDTMMVNWISNRVIRERAIEAQREYGQEIRQRIERGADFGSLVGMPHLSIDTLNFKSFFEAQTRYGSRLAGACYVLEPGDMTGPVKWTDKSLAFFRCLDRSFDPTSSDIPVAVQNEYNDLLNSLSAEVFNMDKLEDYRSIYNFTGGG